MIRHCVMLRLRDDHDPVALRDVIANLQRLTDQLDNCDGFYAGANRDYEGKSPGYRFGFTVDFASPEALSVYSQDPRHQALGSQLVSLCTGGANGIAVYDLEIAEKGAR